MKPSQALALLTERKFAKLPSKRVVSKRTAKAGRRYTAALRAKQSSSMLDQGAPAGHRLPVNDERTKLLMSKYRRQKLTKSGNSFSL
jgi:hypothetical protein